jgi:WD40 repeat protein
VAFSPDGKLLASGSRDLTVRLWDVSSGKELSVLREHGDYVGSVAFSPDGKLLASGSADHSIRLWDVSGALNTTSGSGNQGLVLSGHNGIVLSVAFSPDGKWLASGSYDNTIRLWDISNAFHPDAEGIPEIVVLTGHSAPVHSVAFNPNGKRLASGSADQSVRLWDITLLNEYYINGKEAPSFQKVYRASLYLLPYRLEGSALVEQERPRHFTALNGYRFPETHEFHNLDRPRPVGTDPITWILDSPKEENTTD